MFFLTIVSLRILRLKSARLQILYVHITVQWNRKKEGNKRVFSSPLFSEALAGFFAIDEGDDITYSFELLCLLVSDLNIKFLFQRHDHFR